MNRTWQILLLLLLTGQRIDPVEGSDWAKWRGPFSNGTTLETDWIPNTLDNPKIVWQSDVGSGHSSLAVRGNRLYTMGNQQRRMGDATISYDMVYCIDAQSGKTIWIHEYPCDPHTYPGPGSTPVLDGTNLYTLSRKGHLNCLDAGTGEARWGRHLLEEGLAQKTQWGFTSAAVIDGDILLLNVNKSGMAFHKHTGKVIWNSDKTACRNGSPVLIRNPGRRMAIFSSRDLISFVDVLTGESLKTVKASVDSDPLVIDNRIFVPGFRSTIQCALEGCDIERISSNPGIGWCFQGATEFEGHVYGFGQFNQKEETQAFQCVRLKDNRLVWKKDFELWGASIAAGDKLILITGQGRLIVARASPRGFEEISSAQIFAMKDNTDTPNPLQNHCWTSPVLSGGHLFLRDNHGRLICLDLKS